MSAPAGWPAAPRYIDGSAYESLYENYFGKDPKALLLLVPGGVEGKRVVDLCCGSAPLAKAALDMGAAVAFAVDADELMLPRLVPAGMEIAKAHAGVFLMACASDPVDAIVCRQAVNYWMDKLPGAGGMLASALVSGGALVFNTFLNKPSEVPSVREVGLPSGDKAIEAIWLAPDGKVHHAQFRSGHEPHATSFDWIAEERYHEILEPHFGLEILRKGSSATFVCRKR